MSFAIVIFIIVMLFNGVRSTNAQVENVGGMDFSMLGKEETVPKFRTTEEAIEWAERVKWCEPLRRELKNKIKHLSTEVGEMDLIRTRKYGLAGELMMEREHYITALLIMEYYKKHKVGAGFMASSEPVYGR